MPEVRTLEQRLEEGRVPVAESLRLAMILAETLRRLHDAGQTHGAVTPANLIVTNAGLELMPPRSGPAMSITRYTAPETLLGHPMDARSDIFAFGAILFEMLTGRRAFDGEGPAIVASNLAKAPTPTSGSPAVDRVVGPCLAKNPDARTPRMQIVVMELRLLIAAVRRAEAAATPTRESVDAAAIRGEMRELEARFEARLSLRLNAHEKITRDMQHSASDAVSALQDLLAVLRSELATAKERTVSAAPLLVDDQMQNFRQRIVTHVDHRFEVLTDNIAVIEGTIEAMQQHGEQFERSVAADLVDIEQNIKAQGTLLESARTAMSETDHVVERVVETLESLQRAVLENSEQPAEHAASAAN
jgi:hypothetical protein